MRRHVIRLLIYFIYTMYVAQIPIGFVPAIFAAAAMLGRSLLFNNQLWAFFGPLGLFRRFISRALEGLKAEPTPSRRDSEGWAKAGTGT